MITEKYDKESGAILFKRDKESLKLEDLVKTVEDLTKRVKSLEKTVKSMNSSTS